MPVERHSSMLSAARGAVCRLRHRTAAWGCARLTTACPSNPQPPRASLRGHLRNTQHAYTPEQRHSVTTFAALNVRESPTVLDPGDYEAGQIQASL